MKPLLLRPYITDQTFLPAALELLDTPPSPVRVTLLTIICAFAAVALGWAALGRLDVIATAQGKIVPVGHVKVVQPLQTGKIATIAASDGDHVAAGDVLATLDSRDVRAQLADQQQALQAVRAEVQRRDAAVTWAQKLSLPLETPLPTVPAHWSADVSAEIAEREGRVLEGDANQLASALAAIEAQLVQNEAEQNGLRETITHQREFVDALAQRVDMRGALVGSENGSKADWLDAVGNLKAQQVSLAQEEGQLATSGKQSEILRREWTKTKQSFIDDNLQKLADAAKQADALTQRVRQAELAAEQMTLRSPVDGVVQASALTSVGQVITTGEEVMRIVPVNAPIEVEAYLPNADVGFVRAGQSAVVKIEAFPFTRYGTIEGKVKSVGRDAIAASDAQHLTEDPTSSLGTGRAGGVASATSGLVFPILVELDNAWIAADGADIPLAAGMSVTAEVDTGSRTVLEYIFSPLAEVGSTAMHER